MGTESRLPSCVVIGIENNGLGVVRALAEFRIPCIALAGPRWSPSCLTNTAKVVHCSSWTEEGVVEDLMQIGKNLGAKAPLLITKDEPVLWVSANRERLAPYFHIALPSPDAVNLLMDKTLFERLAIEERWPTPKTWRVSTAGEIEAALGEIPFPCILKPAVKNAAFRLYSPVKARKISDRSALLEAYREFAAWEPEAVVQEWIEGGDDRITFCLGYWDAQSRPRALFPGRKLRQWPVECGNTAAAEPAPVEWRETITSLTTRIMERVGFVGLGSVEFKMRLHDSSPVIMEPTVGRTNYQNEVAVINGVNIPAVAYFDGLGEPARFPKELEQPRLFSTPVRLIDGPADYRAAKIYQEQGRLTREDWRQSRRGPKRYMVFRPNDPMPFLASVFLSGAARFKRTIRGVLRPLVKRTA